MIFLEKLPLTRIFAIDRIIFFIRLIFFVMKYLNNTQQFSLQSLKQIVLVFFLFFPFSVILSKAQEWAAESWTNAYNLTAVMNQSDMIEMSGLHWNPLTNRLYAVQDDGWLRVLQYDENTTSFTEIATISVAGNPEGIMQVEYAENVFYTADEKKYEIRKYTHNDDFSIVSLSQKWRLLTPNSPMTDTDNDGIEGLEFIPDSYLQESGFISTETGLPYTSSKGMGELIFLAHQTEGYIWVYDVNPSLSFDFVYVGKYQTGRKESCDLSFDRTAGLLYILHNIGSNFLEVTDLSLQNVAGEKQFKTKYEYKLSNPTDGNDNIEGFAITPSCNTETAVSLFLCRDVNNEGLATQKSDILRWFRQFPSLGTCTPPTALPKEKVDEKVTVELHPTQGLYLHGISDMVYLSFRTTCGKELLTLEYSPSRPISYDELPHGFFILQVRSGMGIYTYKLLVNR